MARQVTLATSPSKLTVPELPAHRVQLAEPDKPKCLTRQTLEGRVAEHSPLTQKRKLVGPECLGSRKAGLPTAGSSNNVNL